MLSPQFLEEAKTLDTQDLLARFRERFYLPANTLYFDGNSLGLLSKDSEAAVQKALAEWRDLAVLGWTAGTTRMDAPRRDALAQTRPARRRGA